MISRKIVKNELLGLNTLQNIVVAYEEIASIRMKKIKTSVLKNREFLSGLNDIYARIRFSYQREILRLEKKNAQSKKNLLKKNVSSKISLTNNQLQREVVVFLSANTGLFGDIIKKIYQEFRTYVFENDVDLVIVGTMGKQMFDSEILLLNSSDATGVSNNESTQVSKLKKDAKVGNLDYQFFPMTDNLSNEADLRAIVEYVKKYEKVTVFHGEFKDILKQEAVKDLITGEAPNTEFFGKGDVVSCFFEPTLEEVLSFFKTHIMSALFSQAVYESSLSKYTSRMISLDKATENINTRLGKVNLLNQVMQHREYNKKQANTLSGIYLWNSIR